MAIKLTRRQQQFLSQFLDFYHEVEQPIHYPDLAERLGIGKITAYEMLRLLEERGLVKAEYYLPPGNRGPGRSTVHFIPTSKARQLLTELSGGSSDEGYEDLLSDLFVRIPDQSSPLIYSTEMITAILLALETLRGTAEAGELTKRLKRIGLPGEIGLSALGGISAALTMVEQANRRASTFLLAQSGKYQTMISQLSEENRRNLGKFAREVAKIVTG
jgi:DNA-binding MarR family transcriptional regulator